MGQNFKFKITIDGCPDKYFKEDGTDGEYYRIAQDEVINKNDFIPLFYSTKSSDTERINKKVNDNKFLCDATGISIFKELSDAITKMNLYPIGDFIYKGALDKTKGVIKKTSEVSSHHNWYVYDDIDELEIFKEKINI